MAADEKAQSGRFAELGVSGLKAYSGVVNEEFLPELSGVRGLRKFREMAENDPVIGAILRAIDLILRAVEWDVEAADESEEAKLEAEFALSLMDDMSHTFEDFVSEALSMLRYGWSFFEIVLKRRVGPLEASPERRSKFSDGRIGIRKLAIRSQDTLTRWEMQDDGGITGFHQQPPTSGSQRFIPIERGLLFRTVSQKNSPEGVSMLRNAYRPWYFKKLAEESEAVGIERELAGVPVAYVPSQYLKPDAPPADKAFLAAVEKIVRDLKFNEQGGIVLPSDVFRNADGTLSSVRQVEVRLMTSGGQRAIDPNTTITRYEKAIARSVLADFLMLGGDSVGSYALSQDKTGFFMRACEAVLAQIEAPLNRFLLPRVWDYNGLDRALLPRLKPGSISPVDLDKIGNFLRNLSASGSMLFPDDDLDATLRDMAGLPTRRATAGGL